MILPTEIENMKGKEIKPDCWLITNPKFDSKTNKWIALANVSGLLCLIELRVYIKDVN